MKLEGVRSTLQQRDASSLKLQQDVDTMRAELEQEKKRTEGKLQPPPTLVFPQPLEAWDLFLCRRAAEVPDEDSCRNLGPPGRLQQGPG